MLAFCAMAGCAAYQLEPLSANHPAYPDGAAAPERPVSKTLAYTASGHSFGTAGFGCCSTARRSRDSAVQQGEQKTVVGEGKVIATVLNANQLVVEHGEIKGFMGPMTMGYQVDPPTLLEGLKSGDKVRFTIDVPKKTIIRIEKMK